MRGETKREMKRTNKKERYKGDAKQNKERKRQNETRRHKTKIKDQMCGEKRESERKRK